jgi:hypothetical protein
MAQHDPHLVVLRRLVREFAEYSDGFVVASQAR